MRNVSFLAVAVLMLASFVVVGSECEEKLQSYLSDGGLRHPGFEGLLPICQAEAEGGDLEAQYHLSFFYFYGLAGVEESAERGVELIKDAAHAGLPEAQYWMGWQTEEGGALKTDEAIALEWYMRAADSGSSLAMQRLANAYEQGELGLLKNADRATYWRRKSEECDC